MPVDFDLANKIRVAVGEALADKREREVAAGKQAPTQDEEKNLARDLITRQIELHNRELLNNSQNRITKEEEVELLEVVFHSLYGLGRIQTYINNPNVQDIHINGCDVVWVVLRDGSVEQVDPVATSDEELIDMIATAARRLGRIETRFDFANNA